LAARLILGGPDENRETAELAHSSDQTEQGGMPRLPPGIEIEPHRFTVGGRSYNGAGHALLLSFRDPARQNRPVTLLYGLSDDAITPLVPLLFYHGWDSYVVFDKGRAVAEGTLPAARFPLLWIPPQQQTDASPKATPSAGVVPQGDRSDAK
jgi:hypothetical protein